MPADSEEKLFGAEGKKLCMDDLKRFERLASAHGKSGRFLGRLSDMQIARLAHESYRNSVSLLRDVRLLVAASPGRALALTVLALEELGKIPAVFGMQTSDPAERWEKFWKGEFSKHAFKQQVIGGYGKILAAGGRSPYRWFVTEPIAEELDRLKQQGFYVDVVDQHIQSPQKFGTEMNELLDFLFAAAEERADSFAQFHVFMERSAWFLGECRAVTDGARRGSRPLPVSSEQELAAAILSQASRCSAPEPLDYYGFYSACKDLCAQVTTEAGVRALSSVVATLEERTKSEDADKVARAQADALERELTKLIEPEAQYRAEPKPEPQSSTIPGATLLLATMRAYQMLKLLQGYIERSGLREGAP